MAKSSSKAKLSGIQLFKSEVKKVLLDSKDRKLEICHFKLVYKKIFGKDFDYQTYGFSRKKITSYFEDISDIITFDNRKSFISLKEKLNTEEDKPSSSKDYSCKSTFQNSQGNSSKNIETMTKLECFRSSSKANMHTSGSSVKVLPLNEPRKDEAQQSLPSLLLPPDQTTSKHSDNQREKKFKGQTKSVTTTSSDNSLSGIDLFKAEVKKMLKEKGVNFKVNAGQFKQLYKDKFKVEFNPEVYGFERSIKISVLLEKIPDVVSLERTCGSLYMKMNTSCSLPAAGQNMKKEAKEQAYPGGFTKPIQNTSKDSQSTNKNKTSSLPLSHNEKNPEITTSGYFESSNTLDSPKLTASKSIPLTGLSKSAPQSYLSQPRSELTLELMGVEPQDTVSFTPSTSALHNNAALAGHQFAPIPLLQPVGVKSTTQMASSSSLALQQMTRNMSSQCLPPLKTTGLPSPSNLQQLARTGTSSPCISPMKTTGLPAPNHPNISSPKLESTVPSLAAIMQEQEANSSKEELDFTPPSTKSKRRKMNLTSNECDFSEEVFYTTPGPFEESFNSAHSNTLQSTSSPKKGNVKYLSPKEINELTKQVIESISSDGDHVSLEIVKVELCKKIGVRSLSQRGYRNPDTEITELKELSRLLSKLDLYARAYVMVHSISTLTELGQGMARLLEKRDFLDLNVGPLVKLPIVYDLFKAPSDGVRRVNTVHILKHLDQYLTKNDKWTRKVDLKDFIQYLCETYDCTTPYELGVRIQSIGLGISVLKRAQKAQSEKSKKVEQELANDMERDVEKRCKKIKDDLLGSSHGDERSLLGKLLGSSVTDIITKVFDHCQEMFEPKPRKKINEFLDTILRDKLLWYLFGLAIHMGCKDILKEVLEDCKEEFIAEIENSRAHEEAPQTPNKKTLIQETKEWLNAAEVLDLATLARIEQRVIDNFPGFDNFSAFGYGTWLDFLTREKELFKILENRGATMCGEPKNSCNVKVDLNSVLDFIIQCGTATTEDSVQCALCHHYQVNTITDLGLGSFKTLMEKTTHRKHEHQSVVYELALCKGDTIFLKHIHSNNKETARPKAGLLGWKTGEDALNAIVSTPLLGDIKEWTQWDTVFRPCLGDLKQFLQLNKVLTLETEKGSLLKVNDSVTLEDFKKSVDEEDVIGTAGNLVSLVIRYGGIQAAPLSLMTNHINSVLLKLASADQDNGSLRCPRFVLQCLCRIPHRMCVSLASKFFLEPLASAVGTGSSNQLLLSCCDNDQQHCLHQLGLSLGYTDLREDFNSMISGESERQSLVEERRRMLQDLRPVAVIKPVAVEQKRVEEEVEDPIVIVVSEENVESKESSLDDEILVQEGTTSENEVFEEEEQEKIPETNPHKALIESIRREEFGIGVSLGQEESKLVQKQREREGRSLHRLSAELYSKDTHFVLELIQNADDNTFTSDSIPTLLFIIQPHSIMVLNNEVGFEEENIRALCDVGKSTKGAHKYGYIGQKGIGFKSVFRVSDRPEVHSNGYHICFDAKSGPSGYILPHWIDDHIELSSYGNNLSTDLDDLQLESWMTRIVLPLKDEFHGDKKNSLSARFNDVHPSLLLFLHRLRSIILVNKNKIQRMMRQDLENGIIQISDSHGTNRWLVIKKQLKVNDASREDIEMTELALAFPMPKDYKTISYMAHTKTLPAQNVFAYLPLRSYGFKFIIQGDFEVPSSREDVDGDKAWNQRLREEIPKLFIDALDVFKSHPHFSGLASVAKFFQFVPLKEEILDFFNPVAEIILRHLQGMNCLPVEKGGTDVQKGSEKSSESLYDWMQPCKVVVCEDQEIHTLITPDLLNKHLGLHYLARDLTSAINPVLRAELGIKTLSVKHLIEIGKSVIVENPLESQDSPAKLNRVQWIAKWLQCVYHCLEREHNSSSQTLDQISAMKIFPLSDYTFVNLKDNAIFFPLSINKQTMKAKKKRSTAKYLTELEKDLSVLNAELLNHLENVGHSQVEKLLQQLGVKYWTAKDVIHNHILPTFKSDTWKLKSHDVLQSYLVYIFIEHLSDSRVCDMDELKCYAQVLTNKGPKNPNKTPVHFTPRYGNPLNLVVTFPTISWTLIDDSYLNEASAGHQEWTKFFSDLGVQHFLIIERKHTILTKMTLDTSPWSLYCDSWPKTCDGIYVIEDFYCAQLEEFIGKQPVHPQQAKVLAENIDKQWKDCYSKYAEMIPIKDSKENKIGDTLSSFLLYLKTKPWLPVAHSSTCDVPDKLYYKSEELYSVLADHVPYVDIELQDDYFVKVLGLTMTVTLDNLLGHLKEWSKKSRLSSVGQNIGFFTSLAHMKRVYKYIHSITDDKPKIASTFQKDPLIFVPFSFICKEKEEQKIHGAFHFKKEVCWTDPSDVTSKLLKSKKYNPKRQILSVYYKELYDFFRLYLKVDQTPHSDEYIEMASILTEENSLPTPPVVKLLIEIFAVLGEKCLSKRTVQERDHSYMDSAGYSPNNFYFDEKDIEPGMANYFKEKLTKEDIFPCATRWVSLSDKPIESDSKHLKKVFEQEKDVHFIVLEHTSAKPSHHVKGNKLMEKVDIFLRACGIPKLSACVEEKLTTTNVHYQCHEVQEYFHQIVPFVQRYMYHNMHEVYTALVEEKFNGKLAEMTFATVEKLEVDYWLKNLIPEVAVPQEAKWGHQIIGNKIFFYAVNNHVNEVQTREVAKLFSTGGRDLPKRFENFLELLQIKMKTNQDLEGFLYDQEVSSLPNNEEQWYVQAPEIPKTPEIVEEEQFEPLFHADKVQHREYEDDGTLHCWPPRSSASGMKGNSYPEQQFQETALEIWPIPEAPQSTKDQMIKEETNHLQENKAPAKPASNVVNQTSVSKQEDDLTYQQNKTVSQDTKQEPSLVPDRNVNHETPNPERNLSMVYTTIGSVMGTLPQEEPIRQLHDNINVESSFSTIYTPDMQVNVQDLDFEDLPTDDVSLPERFAINENPNREEIGHWGEKLVYEYLLKNHSNHPANVNTTVEIKWMNEQGNSVSPYDIEIKEKTNGIDHSSTFIEVKSTSGDDKEHFEISVPELKFALDQGEKLHLYRVFNAGNSNTIRILRVKDLAAHLEKKTVKVFMII